MVKPDFSRDYYEDLELCPSSGSVEIKRQYKKLALLYHPDRNVGSSTSDTTKFQRILAAYEILNDPLVRARYDANRRTSAFNNTNSSHTKNSTKGNPWSNIGKEYPPPPKPPTARSYQPTPQSNGARRYEKFAPPQQSAYQASQEGSQARKATYDAWEKMRGAHESSSTFPSSKNDPNPPDPPTRNTSKPNQKEKRTPTSSRSQMPDSPNERNVNQSNSKKSARKKGFMPSTPGGDELPAPRRNYFTARANPDPPPIPPRNFQSPTENNSCYFSNENNEANSNKFFAHRVSTPYATHGGERFDPFEASKSRLSRSKSTTEERQNFSSKNDIFHDKINAYSKPSTTHRTRSFSGHTNPNQKPSYTKKSDTKETIDISPTSKSSDHTRSTKIGLDRGPKISEDISDDSSVSSISPVHISSRSKRENPTLNENPNILDDDTFISTNNAQQKPTFGNSMENISTKFSAEEWDGKFSAGSNSDCFKLDSNVGRTFSQPVNQTRARSPAKYQAGSKPEAKTENSSEDSSGRKFSVDEWAETFKQQTFMPPQPMSQSMARSATSSSNSRKRRTTPGIRPILCNSTLSLSDILNESKNQHKPSQESSTLNMNSEDAATPEPMDIDTPLDSNVDPVVPKVTNNNPIKKPKTQVSRASHLKLPTNEVEAQTSALKVNFSDLKIKDLVLDFPMPPNPPVLSQKKVSSAIMYREHEARYQQYMSEWDQFDKKFLLHLVARKNKNESLGEKRWKEEAAEYYRNSIKEDQIVLRKWAEAKETHEKVLTEWIVFIDINKGIELVKADVEKNLQVETN